MSWVWGAMVVWALLAVPAAVALGAAICRADRHEHEHDPPSRPPVQVDPSHARQRSRPVP